MGSQESDMTNLENIDKCNYSKLLTFLRSCFCCLVAQSYLTLLPPNEL